MRLIIAFVLLVWTAACWFTAPLDRPFLNLPVFSIDVLIPFALFVIWNFISLSWWLFTSFRKQLPEIKSWVYKHWKALAVLALILIIYIVLQIPQIVMYRGANDSDSSIFGLASYHIADGSERPMYFYGKHYNGTFAPHVTAVFHLIFGKHPSFLRLANSLIYMGFIVVIFAILRRIADEKIALFSASLLAIPPFAIHLFINNTYFASVLFWGALSFLLLVKMIEAGKPSWKQYFWFGAVIGIGFWAHIQLIYFFFTAIIVLFIRDKLFFARPSIVSMPVGFMLGSIVTVIDSYYYNFIIFRHFFGQAMDPGSRLAKLSSGASEFVKNIPALLGLQRELDHVELYHSLLSIFFLILFIFCFAYFVYSQRGKLKEIILFKNTNPGPVLFLIYFTMVFLIFSMSNESAPPSPARYVAPLWFAMVPIIVFSAFKLPERFRKVGIAVVSVFAVLFVVSNITLDLRVAKLEKQQRQWQKACEDNNITRYYGEFWQTVLTNFYTKEEIIGTSVIKPYFEAYTPHYYEVSGFEGNPAFHFLPPTDEFDDSMSDFERKLESVGVTAKKVDAGIGTLFHGFSERVTAPQLASLLYRPYKASISDAMVFRSEIETEESLRLIEVNVKNSGIAYWKSDKSSGYVEFALTDIKGNEIRRQLLTSDVGPGESVTISIVVGSDELTEEAALFQVKVNDFLINQYKENYSLQVGGTIKPDENWTNSLNIQRPEFASTKYLNHDFVFLSGWIHTIKNDGSLLRWGCGEKAELGFFVDTPGPIKVVMNVFPFRTEGIVQNVNLKLSCNGVKLPGSFRVDKSRQVTVSVSDGIFKPDLNKLVFHFDNAEPEYERNYEGKLILRYKRKSIALTDIKFIR